MNNDWRFVERKPPDFFISFLCCFTKGRSS